MLVGTRIVGMLHIGWLHREPLHGTIVAQRFGHHRIVERRGRKIQLLRHHSLDDQRIDWCPGPWLVVEQFEHGGQGVTLPGLINPPVHAIGIRLQGLSDGAACWEGLPVELRCSVQTQHHLELIG